ncbi:hypothetical protein BFJ72_g2423 [Fusarium proliferatum]|uniref:Uncharacterized protein n=1 Tax=Gibberella intermedia TaxID=948311 RepID=A0A420TYI5_GIBIN|nr:hypothetical protein BFJ72_g2423 [Fusarium proliferatum]
MSTNENNNTVAIPTAGGGFVGITRELDQLVRSMIETGASSVIVQLFKGQDDPTVVTGVIDRAGNFESSTAPTEPTLSCDGTF